MNTLGVAKVDDFLLWKAGVVFDLVDGWDGGGHCEELLEVSLAILLHVSLFFLSSYLTRLVYTGETYIANADATDFAGRESPHLLPGFGVVPVAEDVALAVGEGRELFVVSLNMLVYRHLSL